MHNAVKQFIKEVRSETSSKYGFRSFFRFKKVLEVGSKNINGSPRKYFWFCNYTGIDLSMGKGVDVVARLKNLFFGSYYEFKYYDVVLSCEMLEHDETWEDSLMIMNTILKPGGLLLITCAGPDRAEHGTKRTSPQDSPDTTDYYRNISTEDFRSVLPPELFTHYTLMYGRGMNDLYFWGIKK